MLRRSAIKRGSVPMRRTRMRPIGRRGRERLRVNSELHAQASLEGWHSICEIAPILRERGIDNSPCLGPLTFAHSRKAHRRGSDPVLARTVARGCEFHHFFKLDLLAPKLTEAIVLEAIERRGNARNNEDC